VEEKQHSFIGSIPVIFQEYESLLQVGGKFKTFPTFSAALEGSVIRLKSLGKFI
jgi:hypothetical protein